jgi:multidrug efflux pump subunit AcrA (membrane-fusion protein)
VKIETDAPYRALVVNEEAVQSDLRRRFVWIIRDNKAERVEVKLGETVAPGMRDVVEGIDREDLVVVRGVQFLRPGLPVELVQVDMPGSRDGLKVLLQP